MKLLFLNTDIGYGGAEKMIVWLANKCAEKGHQVSFFTYRDNRVMQPLSPQVKHIHVQLESGGAGLSMFKTARYLHQYIKEERLTNIGRISSFLFVSNVLKFVSSLKFLIFLTKYKY